MSASREAAGPVPLPADTTTHGLPSSSTSEEYPDIQQGASLLLALRLQDRPILLIGGGVVASQRLYFLLESGAHITIVSPSPLDPSISYRISDPNTSPQITWHDRPYLGREDSIKVTEYDLVMTAIDNNPLSQEVCEMCREKRVMVNVADIPPQCDFYFGAQLRKGPLQILISTGGLGPRAGAMIRDIIRNALPENIEESVEGVGLLRSELRKRAPGVGGQRGQERMDWMKELCDVWGLAQMERFRDEQVRKYVLDEGWEKKKMVAPSEVKQGQRKTTAEIWEQVKHFGHTQWAAGLGGFGAGMAVATVATIYLTRNAAR
ncbi:hypothetical protein CI109_105834 [Kwoniella shandongensis]|uniref:precorrin-2 dehydrogenase n=1 Tax=Kwoniella shandongensis TaxID=1734106 RepID=A0A5M6BTB1_9TREE|nr:uncharacterized protein CI109_005731 [Kwoniella shandongensis]KAA5525983.1 hypothetical protein CI109_005731 [Kwoniella shandongensis]